MPGPKEQILHCEYCGADCGTGKRWPGDIVTCGQRECERYARDCEVQRRDEAHEQLDRDMGYGQEWSA
jgi:hypothetical protein